uniref:Putative secreted protein n=1 Tax=Anopheles darlingi TaxID=43151 RepID=A0A2M4DH38_ANODA
MISVVFQRSSWRFLKLIAYLTCVCVCVCVCAEAFQILFLPRPFLLEINYNILLETESFRAPTPRQRLVDS